MSEEAIKLTLEAYARAYCAKDIGALMHVFDDSDNISVIGTGADELCVGRKAIKELFLRNFKEATAQKFEWDWIDVRVSENSHAVLSVTLIIHLVNGDESLQIPIRWTIVLKRQGTRWAWIHRNASTANSSQRKGKAYPNNQIHSK